MNQSNQNSKKQSIISYLIIGVLVLIVVYIFLTQGGKQAPTSPKAVKTQTVLADDLFGSDFKPAGNGEIYDSNNLYVKIDGREDLYLNNGFKSLQCRRFVKNNDKNAWAEVYLYDVNSSKNAFSVYSQQKRFESTPLDWTQTGSSTSDSVCAAFDKYYMEIVLSSADANLLNSSQMAGRKLASAYTKGQTEMPFFGLFPKENLVADSFKFINADAFSCSDLKDIYTAEYKINGNTVTAYISPTLPAETYEKYYRFLTNNGAEPIPLGFRLPAYRAYKLYNTNEIFFFNRAVFAGVRGTAPLEDVKNVFEKLYINLSANER